GIRDRNVTGVQTCALPILTELKEQDPMSPLPDRGMLYFFAGSNDLYHRAPSDRITCQVIYANVHPDELIPAPFPDDLPREAVVRSEERRVGKECMSRGSRG